MSKSFSIVFMGTPGFAVESLKKLNEKFTVKAVITAPDKPAGRGRKIQESDVKKAAVSLNIPLLQPNNLKDEGFVNELKAIDADLFVVVAFRMLPEVVWNMPKHGTINLHASLLPQYRGAAPINWAIINGEKVSGASTFFLQHKIDTGNIIDQVKIEITEEDTAGTYHDKLMVQGAECLVNTVDKIEKGEAEGIPQEHLIESELKEAPKIFKDTCKINWNDTVDNIYNKIRGLSPYPAAWSNLSQNEKELSVKFYQCVKGSSALDPGKIKTDNKTYLEIGTLDGSIVVKELQLSGKKRLNIEDLLRGFSLEENACFS